MKYDAVIVGSGLGGLLCGAILSKEGYRVCVIEKNRKLGGCLQSMHRKGCVFNTGVHFIGSLDEGQVLHRYLTYFGLNGNIDVRRLDENGFDVIGFPDGKEYPMAMGGHFIDNLLEYFPDERDALNSYMNKMKEVCATMPYYSLDDRLYGAVVDTPYLGTGAAGYIGSLTKNRRLQQVLSGNDLIYGKLSEHTPLMLYAMINYSYISSAWRMTGDSEQISRLLAAGIRAKGGTLIAGRTVEKFRFEHGELRAAVLHTGEEVEGNYFIAGIHPQNVLQMIAPGYLKNSYIKKVENLRNTSGFFVLHVVLKEKTFPYFNHNYYQYNTGRSWPQKYLMIPAGKEQEGGYAQAVSLLTDMDYQEVRQWEHTTVGHRGADYVEFKARKAEQLIEAAEQRFNGFKQAIAEWHSSTPLSYRDYTGTPEGSAYGVRKDCNRPLSTMVFPRTGISNLLLTGQNVYFHGVLGVSIGAVATCGELLGTKYLMDKIR
jgi:all-trans-retinol 13,14-reductase